MVSRICAPLNPKKPDKLERFIIPGCWFQGCADPEEIRSKYGTDCGCEEGNGMLVTFRKISPGAVGLGGKLGG